MFPSRAMTVLGGDSFRDEYSLAFDGSNDYLNCGGFNVGTSDFTIAMWVKFPQNASDNRDNTYNYLMGSWTNDENYWYLRTDANSKLHFFDRISDSNVIHHIGSATIGIDAWYHLVFTRDRSTPLTQMYVNGAFDSTDNNSDAGASLAFNNFAINRGAAAFTSYGEGSSEENYYSDVTVYNKALSASEVATIYNGREPYNHKEGIASGNLQAWWRMGDGRFDGLQDVQGLISDEAVTPTLSTQIIADGGFGTAVGESTTGTYWITEAGWTISGGSATYDGGGDSNTQLESITNSDLEDGVVHQVNFTLTDTGGGGVYVRICGGSFALVTGTGEKTVYLLAGTGTNRLTFETGHDYKAFTIDDVSVYKTNGNPGVMVNMAAEDFVGDTP